ncbi:MAG: energy transducer TonB [Bacteroidota bacterium]|nr:energy transducer TonB [Bacteroidota bacterium]
MRNEKEKIRATVGTILFHLLLLLALILFGLSTPLPLPGEEGVEVNLGYTDQGMGLRPENQQPSTSPPQPKPQEEIVEEEVAEESAPEETMEDPVIEDVQEEELITQDTEEAPALNNPEEKKETEELPDETKKEEEKKPEPKEEAKEESKQPQNETEQEPEQVEEKEPEPKVNPRALYKGPTKSEGQGGNEGQTGEAGNQGEPNGDVDSQNYEGKGGQGSGVEFGLEGRGAKHLPKPEYNSDDQGTVIVTIWVDRMGKVTKAVAGAKGTTVSDQVLWRRAKEAALRARFTAKPDAAEIQKGFIKYNFIKLK